MENEIDSPCKRSWSIAEVKSFCCEHEKPILLGYGSHFIPILRVDPNLPVSGIGIHFEKQRLPSSVSIETLLDEWRSVGVYNRHLIKRTIIYAPSNSLFSLSTQELG